MWKSETRNFGYGLIPGLERGQSAAAVKGCGVSQVMAWVWVRVFVAPAVTAVAPTIPREDTTFVVSTLSPQAIETFSGRPTWPIRKTCSTSGVTAVSTQRLTPAPPAGAGPQDKAFVLPPLSDPRNGWRKSAIGYSGCPGVPSGSTMKFWNL